MKRRQWVAFGPELLEHDSVLNLAGCMGISRTEAAGYIALAVAYAIKMADDTGRIDHLTDKAIENACYWDGVRGALVSEFCRACVFTGDRESDDLPLRIEPGLWRFLAGDAIKGREQSRITSQRSRANKANS